MFGHVGIILACCMHCWSVCVINCVSIIIVCGVCVSMVVLCDIVIYMYVRDVCQWCDICVCVILYAVSDIFCSW